MVPTELNTHLDLPLLGDELLPQLRVDDRIPVADAELPSENFLLHPTLTAPTRDPGWYTWRAQLLTAAKPSSVVRDWGPFGMFSGGYRVSMLLTGAWLIRMAGIPEGRLRLDLSIARGLDYYTGTIYETFLLDRPKFGSVCGRASSPSWWAWSQPSSLQPCWACSSWRTESSPAPTTT